MMVKPRVRQKIKLDLRHFVELAIGIVALVMGAAYFLEAQPVILGSAYLVLGAIFFIQGLILCLACLLKVFQTNDGNNTTDGG